MTCDKSILPATAVQCIFLHWSSLCFWPVCQSPPLLFMTPYHLENYILISSNIPLRVDVNFISAYEAVDISMEAHTITYCLSP